MRVRQDRDEADDMVMVKHTGRGGGYDGVAQVVAVRVNDDDDDARHLSPKAWLARFGRTVAEQVLEAIGDRISAPGLSRFEGRLAGQGLGGVPHDWARASGTEGGDGFGTPAGWLGAEADPAGPHDSLHRDSRALTGRDILTGTAFALTGDTADGGSAAIWGRGAVSRFDGREGDLVLDGEVTTGLAGVDYRHGSWTAGLVASLSHGEGGYRGPDDSGGEIETSFSGLYPWASRKVSEYLALWGVAGYGEGALTLRRSGTEPIEVDTDLTLARWARVGRC